MKQSVTAGILDLKRAMAKPSTVLIAILALTFYLRLLYFGQIIDGDVGRAGYLGWRMAEGEVLIDFEGPGKPPLYSMLYAVFICLFGPSVLELKVFGTVFVLMAVLAVYWVANQAYGKKVGFLAALLFGVFSSGPMIEGGTVNLETVLHLPYILAIGLFLKASESGRLRWYFLAGLCAAMATLVKQVGGVLFFVFLCYGIHEWWRKPPLFLPKQWLHPVRKPRHLWRGWRKKCSFLIEGGVQSPALSNGVYRYILLCAGALLPVIGVISFYHFHGYTLNQLYDSMLGSNLSYIQRAHEFTSVLGYFSYKMKVFLPENGLLWVGTVFAATYLVWRTWRGKEQTADRILLWWAFWSFAVLWLTGTFYWHYFLQLIAPFSILAAYGIVATWKLAKSLSPLPRSLTRGGWTILVVVMILIFIKTDYKYFFTYTPVEQTVFQHNFLDGVHNEYGIWNIFLQRIAYYIRDNTDPTETIYVWGIAPQVYFLAQRKAATRYISNSNMSFLVTNDSFKALQAYAPTVMEEIGKSHPAYIVGIFPIEYFPELQTFVRDQYMVERSVELPMPPHWIHLYRRRHDIQ
jgi:4-amino-4-deoxy-L-arabinose transferase-like glycosyltransferase